MIPILFFPKIFLSNLSESFWFRPKAAMYKKSVPVIDSDSIQVSIVTNIRTFEIQMNKIIQNSLIANEITFISFELHLFPTTIISYQFCIRPKAPWCSIIFTVIFVEKFEKQTKMNDYIWNLKRYDHTSSDFQMNLNQPQNKSLYNAFRFGLGFWKETRGCENTEGKCSTSKAADKNRYYKWS